VIDYCVSIIPHERRVVKGEFEGDYEPPGAGCHNTCFSFISIECCDTADDPTAGAGEYYFQAVRRVSQHCIEIKEDAVL